LLWSLYLSIYPRNLSRSYQYFYQIPSN
jgi:hypothetical protein